MKQFHLIPFLFLFLMTSVQAQDSCAKWALGLDLDVLVPYDELQDKGHRSNIGCNLDVLYTGFQQPKIKFYPGFRFRAGGSETENRSEYLSDPLQGLVIHGVYNLLVEAKIAGRVLLHPLSIFTPYVEADMGVRFSGAYDKYTADESDAEFDEYTENIVNEFSGVYGAGGGILIRLNEVLDLNLSTNFDWTNSMKYVNFRTEFPYDTALTKNAINQRFAIGLFVKLGCDRNDDYEPRQSDRRVRRPRSTKKPNISPPTRNNRKN